MAEKRTTYKIQDLGGIGEVQIADEVVAIIAGLAATEVDGVASMAGNITNELVSKLGMKNLSKGVKVTVLEGVVTVDLNLNIEYGKNILETSKKVQEKVKSSIGSITPSSDILARGEVVIFRKCSRKVSTPKFVRAEPKNTGVSSPLLTSSWSKSALAPSRSSISSRSCSFCSGSITSSARLSFSGISSIIPSFVPFWVSEKVRIFFVLRS